MAQARPTALITGVGGQDGVYLARLLARRGHHVVGTVQPRVGSTMSPYLDGIDVVTLDVRDRAGFAQLLESTMPAQVYNLAAFTSVGASWQNAELVGETNGMAVLRMLEALVEHRDRHGAAPRFYQASTSEMFGVSDQQPQTIGTPHHPRSPYAAAKSFAHNLTVNYRESYGLFTCSGVLYNHESPLRPLQFVTRKITRGAAEIALGRRDSLTLGNLDIRRDWGAASDYVEAMLLTMERDEPGDFLIASGVSRSLRHLLEVAFDAAGLSSPDAYLHQDPALMRPADVMETRGDPTKTREILGWEPTVGFEDLIAHMVRMDMRRISSGVEEDPAYL